MTNHSSGRLSMQNPRKEHLYKVLVIGDLGVGKTAVIRRYVHQTYSANYRATIGVDFALKVLNWDSETIRLQLWDIAGGELICIGYAIAVGTLIFRQINGLRFCLPVFTTADIFALKNSE